MSFRVDLATDRPVDIQACCECKERFDFAVEGDRLINITETAWKYYCPECVDNEPNEKE